MVKFNWCKNANGSYKSDGGMIYMVEDGTWWAQDTYHWLEGGFDTLEKAKSFIEFQFNDSDCCNV